MPESCLIGSTHYGGREKGISPLATPSFIDSGNGIAAGELALFAG